MSLTATVPKPPLSGTDRIAVDDSDGEFRLYPFRDVTVDPDVWTLAATVNGPYFPLTLAPPAGWAVTYTTRTVQMQRTVSSAASAVDAAATFFLEPYDVSACTVSTASNRMLPYPGVDASTNVIENRANVVRVTPGGHVFCGSVRADNTNTSLGISRRDEDNWIEMFRTQPSANPDKQYCPVSDTVIFLLDPLGTDCTVTVLGPTGQELVFSTVNGWAASTPQCQPVRMDGESILVTSASGLWRCVYSGGALNVTQLDSDPRPKSQLVRHGTGWRTLYGNTEMVTVAADGTVTKNTVSGLSPDATLVQSQGQYTFALQGANLFRLEGVEFVRNMTFRSAPDAVVLLEDRCIALVNGLVGTYAYGAEADLIEERAGDNLFGLDYDGGATAVELNADGDLIALRYVGASTLERAVLGGGAPEPKETVKDVAIALLTAFLIAALVGMGLLIWYNKTGKKI